MKLHGKEVDIEINDIIPFSNEQYKGFTIQWSGNIGWGEYTIYYDNIEGVWHADSECMDKGDDKEFLTLLLNEFIKQVRIDL